MKRYHQVYLSGWVKPRRYRPWGLPRGAPFVLFIDSFSDYKAAHQYAKILEATTGYFACVLWGDAPLHKAGEPFYHRWFFS